MSKNTMSYGMCVGFGGVVGIFGSCCIALWWLIYSIFFTSIPSIPISNEISHWWNCLSVIPFSILGMVIFWMITGPRMVHYTCILMFLLTEILVGGFDLVIGMIAGVALSAFVFCIAIAWYERSNCRIPIHPSVSST